MKYWHKLMKTISECDPMAEAKKPCLLQFIVEVWKGLRALTLLSALNGIGGLPGPPRPLPVFFLLRGILDLASKANNKCVKVWRLYSIFVALHELAGFITPIVVKTDQWSGAE
jgi:hypothetical protein